jgi:ATP-dependent DNA helicase RecG
MSIDVHALLDELNQTDEHERIEAKTGSEPGKAVMKTVVAFSNEPRLDGGYVLFGVQRQEGAAAPAYRVVGVPDPDKVQADFTTQCANMLNRPVRPRVTAATIDGKPVVAAYIPEARPGEKPVYIESKGIKEGTYRRVGSSDVRCGDADLRDLFAEDSGETYDASIVRDADLDDIDPAALEDYRKTRARVNPGAEELNWSDEDLLRSLRCARKDDDTTLRPTVAGLLLFGSPMALRRLFPSMRVDYLRVPGREWVEDPDRRYISSIEIRTPLMQAIRRAQSAVVDDLPKGFSLPEGRLQRTDEPLIPLRVLREAIVNALMHRDYRRNSAVQIIRYANRIEIRNPGYSLVATDELGEPKSETRNPVIASVLHDTRFAETKGTGISVMQRDLRAAGLAPAEFSTSRRADLFVTTLFLHHFLGSEDLSWLGRFKHLKLSEAEVRGLIHAREAGQINNQTYRELNGLGTLKASQDLIRLRDAGLLHMEDRGSKTYYEPTDKLLGFPDAQQDLFSDDENTDVLSEITKANARMDKADAESDKAGAKGDRALGEKHKAETADDRGEEIARVLRAFPGLPDDLRSVVETVHGNYLRGNRLPDTIRHLCRWRALSVSELARLLGKSKSYVNRHVRRMREAGHLERLHPDAPSSPDQKYRTPPDA